MIKENLDRIIRSFRLTAGIMFVFIACNNKTNIEAKDKLTRKKEEIPEVQKLNITYRYDTIHDTTAMNAFKTNYNAAQQKVIAAVNRIDPWRIRLKSALVIPDTVLQDFIAYTPYPATIEGLQDVPKFIMINQRVQLMALYENGKLIRTGPTSSGRKSKPTPNKLYYTNFKAKKKRSTVDGDWIMPWYFNISNKGGIAMHQYTLPGYPASHSCIRMYEEDAKFIFDWADQWVLSADGNTVEKKGTPVLVFGIYDFAGTPVWKSLPQDPKALELTNEEISTINDAIQQVKAPV